MIKTDATRRILLTGTAATVFGALSEAAAAERTATIPTRDPIFAALALHRRYHDVLSPNGAGMDEAIAHSASIVLQTKPTTLAGAVALLRFASDEADGMWNLDLIGNAIRNALAVLEREEA